MGTPGAKPASSAEADTSSARGERESLLGFASFTIGAAKYATGEMDDRARPAVPGSAGERAKKPRDEGNYAPLVHPLPKKPEDGGQDYRANATRRNP